MTFEIDTPLPGARFGARIRPRVAMDPAALVAAAEAEPAALPAALARANGLLLLQGLQAMAHDPALLVRLSRIFGPEVEDYVTRSRLRTWCTRRCRRSSSSPTRRR